VRVEAIIGILFHWRSSTDERRFLPRQIACLVLVSNMEGRETLGYLCKLWQLRDNGVVSEGVFLNVREDYEKRLAEIAERKKQIHA